MKLYINNDLEICANENGWPEEPVPGDDIAAHNANMNYYRRWLKEAKEQSVIVYDVPHNLGLHFDVRNWSADMFIEMPCDVEFGWQFKNEDDQWINATNGDLRFIFAKYETRKVARLKPSKEPIRAGLTEQQMDDHIEALTAPFPPGWKLIQMTRCCQDMHKENLELREKLAVAEKRCNPAILDSAGEPIPEGHRQCPTCNGCGETAPDIECKKCQGSGFVPEGGRITTPAYPIGMKARILESFEKRYRGADYSKAILVDVLDDLGIK